MVRALVVFVAAAVFAAVAAPGAAVAQAEDGLVRYEIEGWTIEVVRGGDRAACSLIREDAGGVSLVVSRVSDSPFVLPVMEIVAVRDPFAAGPVAMAAAAARARVELDTFFDEDGVHVAAYPSIDQAAQMIAAMRVAADLTLEQNGDAVAVMPLVGFAAAYAEVTRICGG